MARASLKLILFLYLNPGAGVGKAVPLSFYVTQGQFYKLSVQQGIR